MCVCVGGVFISPKYSFPFIISLGIIMSEILTHDSPFHEYLDYVEVQDVLDAVAGIRSINSMLPKSWPQSRNTKELRPTIPEDCDPGFAKV